ncbi:tetratricopeptide repeat protein [[Eubacterium] cellulosolvens]
MSKPEHKDERYKEIGKLIAKKKYSQARRTAEKLAGSDANFLCDVGMLFKNIGQPISAKYLLKRALDIDPKNPVPHYSYGLYLKSNKQLKDAEVEFRKTLKYDKHHLPAKCMLGNTLLEQNKVAAAEAEFIEVLEEDNKNLFALTGLAAVHMKNNEFAEAERIYKKLIKIEKYYPVSYVNLVMLYQKQGREKEMNKVIKLAEKANLKITFTPDGT